MNRPYVDLKLLARNLCLEEAEAMEWVEKGILPRARLIRGKMLWKWSEVDRAMMGETQIAFDRVYFIEAGGFIKIGFTRELEQRLKSLATAMPFPVVVLLDVQGDYDLETDLHRMFAHLRERGEWFRKAPELLDHIERLRNATRTKPDMSKWPKIVND